MIDTGLKGRTALITGGNNPYGIGAAVAKALAEQDAAVLVHYFRRVTQHVAAAKAGGDVSAKPKGGEPTKVGRDEAGEAEGNAPVKAGADKPAGAEGDDESAEPEGTEPPVRGLEFFYEMQAKSADEVVREIRDKGGQAESWEADLSDPSAVAQLFDRAERAFGPVEVLVNNAAEYEADTFLPDRLLAREKRALWADGPQKTTITAASHGRHFDVNTRAVALMMAEFAQRHVAHEHRWGRIVNVSADCSEGSPGEISYRASKHALESYSRSAAAELGPLGITVNIVSPGPIQTGYISSDIERQLIRSIPLGRVGLPEDVAAAVVFLASDQAGWVTGQLITVHGGHRMSPGI